MAKTYMKLDGDLVPVSLDAKVTTSKEEQTKTVASPNFSSGNVIVTPDAGKVLTQVTVVKDNDLVPENIVKDVNIFGVIGTAYTGGGASGGYTVTFYYYYPMRLGDITIIQSNGNHFEMTLTPLNHTSGQEVIFENVTYIQWDYPNFVTYSGITEAELIAGKTLTNDIVLSVHD